MRAFACSPARRPKCTARSAAPSAAPSAYWYAIWPRSAPGLLACRGLERFGHAAVQARAPRDREIAVDAFAHEVMRESKARGLPVGAHEPDGLRPRSTSRARRWVRHPAPARARRDRSRCPRPRAVAARAGTDCDRRSSCQRNTSRTRFGTGRPRCRPATSSCPSSASLASSETKSGLPPVAESTASIIAGAAAFAAAVSSRKLTASRRSPVRSMRSVTPWLAERASARASVGGGSGGSRNAADQVNARAVQRGHHPLEQEQAGFVGPVQVVHDDQQGVGALTRCRNRPVASKKRRRASLRSRSA